MRSRWRTLPAGSWSARWRISRMPIKRLLISASRRSVLGIFQQQLKVLLVILAMMMVAMMTEIIMMMMMTMMMTMKTVRKTALKRVMKMMIDFQYLKSSYINFNLPYYNAYLILKLYRFTANKCKKTTIEIERSENRKNYMDHYKRIDH